MADTDLASKDRVCTRCQRAFPATQEHFPSDKSKRSGLRAQCRACDRARKVGHNTKEQAKAWRLRNPDYQRQWLSQNPGYYSAWKSRLPDGKRDPACFRKHYRLNPEQYRLKSNHRRARKIAAGGKITVQDVAKIYAGQKGRCWWCSKVLSDYHMDHRIPLARGGSNGPENIVLACPPCNLRKGAKMPWELDAPRLF